MINHSKGGVSFAWDSLTTAGPCRLIIPVDYNVPQHFEFILGAAATIFFGETTTRTADFGSTATLTTIDLFDANSDPITASGTSSDSGTSYPVPEPTSALLLAGLAVACLRRR